MATGGDRPDSSPSRPRTSSLSDRPALPPGYKHPGLLGFIKKQSKGKRHKSEMIEEPVDRAKVGESFVARQTPLDYLDEMEAILEDMENLLQQPEAMDTDIHQFVDFHLRLQNILRHANRLKDIYNRHIIVDFEPGFFAAASRIIKNIPVQMKNSEKVELIQDEITNLRDFVEGWRLIRPTDAADKTPSPPPAPTPWDAELQQASSTSLPSSNQTSDTSLPSSGEENPQSATSSSPFDLPEQFLKKKRKQKPKLRKTLVPSPLTPSDTTQAMSPPSRYTRHAKRQHTQATPVQDAQQQISPNIETRQAQSQKHGPLTKPLAYSQTQQVQTEQNISPLHNNPWVPTEQLATSHANPWESALPKRQHQTLSQTHLGTSMQRQPHTQRQTPPHANPWTSPTQTNPWAPTPPHTPFQTNASVLSNKQSRQESLLEKTQLLQTNPWATPQPQKQPAQLQTNPWATLEPHTPPSTPLHTNPWPIAEPQTSTLSNLSKQRKSNQNPTSHEKL